MYSPKIRRYLITSLAIGWGIAFIYLALILKAKERPFALISKNQKIEAVNKNEPLSLIDQAREFLRVRKDMDALGIFDKILLADPNNLDALWGKAEVFRRAGQYKVAEFMFKEILNARPGYAPALIGLSYIKYKDRDFKGSLSLTEQAFIVSGNNKQNQALAYMMLGLINNAAQPKAGIIAGINHSLETKIYLLKASRLGPQLPETHFNLGTFYLKTPMLAGGNLNKAIKELEYAVKIAPDFARANALLAQAYKKKKNENYFAGF